MEHCYFVPLSDAIKRKHLSCSPGVVIAREGHPQVSGSIDMDTYLALTMAASFAARANVWFDNQVLPSPFLAPEIDTYLYWHSNCDADQANIWFRDMIEQAVTENISQPL